MARVATTCRTSRDGREPLVDQQLDFVTAVRAAEQDEGDVRGERQDPRGAPLSLTLRQVKREVVRTHGQRVAEQAQPRQQLAQRPRVSEIEDPVRQSLTLCRTFPTDLRIYSLNNFLKGLRGGNAFSSNLRKYFPHFPNLRKIELRRSIRLDHVL